MSKSNTYEADLLKLYFNATAITNIATATSPATDIYVALFTADPTDTGSLTNEAAYTGYARVAVPRTSATPGWAISGTAPTQASPTANIDFPVSAGGSTATLTHFGVSRTIGGAPDYIGTITPSIAMAAGVIPRITTASTITED